jgi:predicted O-methyltransferase YrrM
MGKAQTSRSPAGFKARIKRMLTSTLAGRIALIPPRAVRGLRAAQVGPKLRQVLAWSVRSREIANFTYDTSRTSKLLLAATVAEIAGAETSQIAGYIEELEADRELAAHVVAIMQGAQDRWSADPFFAPGRRLAFYLAARALKPRHVVEAGVEKGLGAVLLSRAIQRNAAEGHPGEYLGIEFNRARSITLYDTYPERAGHIERGDSLAVLRSRQQPIDLFIHDTVPEPGHMRAQLEAVLPLMSAGGLIASTWTTPELIDHALGHGLKLLTHQEEPEGHWFAGDRVAFIYGYRQVAGRKVGAAQAGSVAQPG